MRAVWEEGLKAASPDLEGEGLRNAGKPGGTEGLRVTSLGTGRQKESCRVDYYSAVKE